MSLERQSGEFQKQVMELLKTKDVTSLSEISQIRRGMQMSEIVKILKVNEVVEKTQEHKKEENSTVISKMASSG